MWLALKLKEMTFSNGRIVKMEYCDPLFRLGMCVCREPCPPIMASKEL